MRCPSCRAQDRQTYDKINSRPNRRAWMPAHWPAGSYFVLLDGAPQQIELAASGRNILQYFQIGPAARPYSDYSYRKLSAAFAGNGLRPYAPVHLDQKWDGTDVEFSWIRRALGWGLLGFG